MDGFALALILWWAFVGSIQAIAYTEYEYEYDPTAFKRPSTPKTTNVFDVTHFEDVGDGNSFEDRAIGYEYAATAFKRPSTPKTTNEFDVTHFGAVGDGKIFENRAIGYAEYDYEYAPTAFKRPSTPKTTNVFDVTHFGAIGDGKTFDNRAFQSAWEAACMKGTRNVKIIVPGGKTFLVDAIKFEGPCKSSSVTFQILGNIVAPPRSAWRTKCTDAWIWFHGVDGLAIDGNKVGVINGLGQSWWQYKSESLRPTAMRFSNCNNLRVTRLKYLNSQQNHVSINSCHGATISYLEMRAPETSPNTDGIDISTSTNLKIHDCIMATGDDCIAINGGTSNVDISNIACGPGHGISIGSLGRNGEHDEVETISVTSCTFYRTENGVRIKTWQGGSGFARNIAFSNITFIEANNPVIIDQYYCPHKTCGTKASSVQVSDVRFSGLHGTSSSSCEDATINLSCSQTVPCTNITLENVNIRSASRHTPTAAHCINAHGQADHTLSPVVNCLMDDKFQ